MTQAYEPTTPEAKVLEFINNHILGQTENGENVYLRDQFDVESLLVLNKALKPGVQ